MSVKEILMRLGIEGIVEIFSKVVLWPFGIAGISIFYLIYIPVSGTNTILGLDGRALFINVMGFILVAHSMVSFIDLLKTLRARNIIY
ncbi:MAG: hypothetical protein O3A93_01670 [Chloroflexi bacterium]|nr:hypothetical protein [Chloroflexota bacterium]